MANHNQIARALYNLNENSHLSTTVVFDGGNKIAGLKVSDTEFLEFRYTPKTVHVTVIEEKKRLHEQSEYLHYDSISIRTGKSREYTLEKLQTVVGLINYVVGYSLLPVDLVGIYLD